MSGPINPRESRISYNRMYPKRFPMIFRNLYRPQFIATAVRLKQLQYRTGYCFACKNRRPRLGMRWKYRKTIWMITKYPEKSFPPSPLRRDRHSGNGKCWFPHHPEHPNFAACGGRAQWKFTCSEVPANVSAGLKKHTVVTIPAALIPRQKHCEIR